MRVGVSSQYNNRKLDVTGSILFFFRSFFYSDRRGRFPESKELWRPKSCSGCTYVWVCMCSIYTANAYIILLTSRPLLVAFLDGIFPFSYPRVHIPIYQTLMHFFKYFFYSFKTPIDLKIIHLVKTFLSERLLWE